MIKKISEAIIWNDDALYDIEVCFDRFNNDIVFAIIVKCY